jgi:hypothetical protein
MPAQLRIHLVAIVLSLAGVSLGASMVGAQTIQLRPHIGVGYVVSAPHQYLGFSAQALSLSFGGVGVYIDAKFDRSSPTREPDFDETLSAEEAENRFGDLLFFEESSWRSFNAALIRPLIPELLLYLGAGHSRQIHYRQYLDESGGRGLDGYYWVEDPRGSGTRLNLLGGAFFRISPTILVQFGVESKPRGMTVGGTYTFTR